MRLPPYHCQLDAIDLVWADLKNFVTKENTTCNLETVEKLFRERRSVLISEFCGKCVKHVKRVEKKYIETDRIVNLKLDQLLITIKEKVQVTPSVTGMEAGKTNRIR